MCARRLSCTYTKTLEKLRTFVNNVLPIGPIPQVLAYVIMPE